MTDAQETRFAQGIPGFLKGRGDRPSVVRSLSMRLMAATTLAFAVLYSYWGYDLYQSMNNEVRYRAETLMEERRTYIRALVETAVNGAEHQRKTVKARTRRVIRDRVQLALRMADHLWSNRPEGQTDAEAAAAIREALRPIRYDNGRGYYFAFDIKTGEGILHAAMPELEGTDLREVRDPAGRPIVPSMIEMIQTEGDGYYTYFWSHPNRPGGAHRKVSYVGLFEPLGWGIACGDYIEDMTADIKAETLGQLRAMQFGENGYIFAGTWDGLSLLGPGAGENLLHVTDMKGLNVVRELVAAARAGGGFVHYHMPNLGQSTASMEKLSYVLPVPEWEWYVGAGVGIEDINNGIDAIRADIRRVAFRDLLLGTGLIMILAAASYAIALRSARRVGSEMRRLEVFLAEDGRHPEQLNPDRMSFGELKRLAEAVKGMAARRDATEAALEHQTRNLEKSNSDLERFAYVASHDLREPLRIIASYVGLLRRRYHGKLDADADTFIDYATDGAQRMHDMIGDLLEYARVQRADMTFVGVPLERVVQTAWGNLGAKGRETGAGISIASPLPTVCGQEALLVSLMQNLFENAMKYRHPDRPPRLEVGCRVDGEGCVVSVADNGMGIDPEFFERIFQIFQRLHPGGTFPGTGVGLSICQSIAERHGGRIWVESEPDVGTRFYIALRLPSSSGECG